MMLSWLKSACMMFCSIDLQVDFWVCIYRIILES